MNKFTKAIREKFGKKVEAFKESLTQKPKTGKVIRVYFKDRRGVRHLPSGARYAMKRTGWIRLGGEKS